MKEPSHVTRPPSAFSKGTVILDYRDLRYNPCDDLIFPSVIRASDYFSRPLAKYYMYYAPHDAPGGVCLACADTLEGPWKEHERNPLISNVWPPHYSVHHVSSPHAIFVPEASRLFLYYHGDNDVTRYATSEDGLSFEYGGVAADRDLFETATGTPSRVFYAKVFRHESPSGLGRYAMLFLASKYPPPGAPYTQGLYIAWSHDARTWQVDPGPILEKTDLRPNEYVCSPFLFSWGGRRHVLYHRDRSDANVAGGGLTDVCRVEVDADLRRIGPQELVCPRQAFGDGNERVSDPCVFAEGDDLYLFVSIGPRLNQRIGLTKVPINAML